MGVWRIRVLLSVMVLSMLLPYGLATSRLQQGKHSVARSSSSSSSGDCGGHMEEVQKCMSDIMNDVIRAQFGNIGQTCCTVVAEIGQDCNLDILPFDPVNDPFWGPIITGYCTATP